MSIREIRVTNAPDLPDSLGDGVLYDLRHSLKLEGIYKVRTAKVYRFEGIDENQAQILAEKLLAETVFQQYTLEEPVLTDYDALVEVAYKPGVMNPEAASIVKAANDLGITNLVAADSSREYAFYGQGATESNLNLIVEKLLVNATVEMVVKEKPEHLVLNGQAGFTRIIPLIDMNEQELLALSQDALFLNLIEMRTIQNYFRDLGRNPTDCELETLAQTWSEHCGHKTFKAKLLVDGQEKPSLLHRLQKSTREANHPLVLSAFVDNSGVMEFYDGQAICAKVETHNSPSAIEPYGGAMTGSGGVFRDIMGTGQGAKVIASTDMFCFAPPDTPEETIPPGCLHPHYLLRRVVAGVRDYGNRMGIPTNNGSVHFHSDFRAKPSIIVGAYGMLPVDKCQKGQPKPGDLGVVLGGRTGRDGIHGATFSSGEMTDRTLEVNASAVQIGNAVEEKRTLEALLEASEKGLIRAVTDCGAGGFSSALGEMGEKTGVKVNLEKAPLKYSGLSPWEIWLSESQERMVLAVEPDNIADLLEICRSYNVEATILAEFTGDKKLTVTYNQEVICDLDMEFLHDGLPSRIMQAAWKAPADSPEEAKIPLRNWEETCKQVLSHWDVCSKEPIVRVYDHGVQGSCALPPFIGVEEAGPNDAVLLVPILGRDWTMVISHGLNPVLNNLHPYYGCLWAATEAVSNAIATGANPRELCLIDNFIWPFPDEESLGALDLAIDACVDFVKASGMPFISGKDSLSSTYRREGEVIKIPPVLCVSVFGRLPDWKKTVSSDLKAAGNLLWLAGSRNPAEMGGSVFYRLQNLTKTNLPKINLANFMQTCQEIYQAIQNGQIKACHDLSEGGLAAAAAEMAFGGGLGLKLQMTAQDKPEEFLFNETAGCFLIETEPGIDLSSQFSFCRLIGSVQAEPEIIVQQGEQTVLKAQLADLKQAWQKPLKEVFG